MPITWRKSAAEWAEHVQDADAAWVRGVERVPRAAPRAIVRSVAPTVAEIDAIIATASSSSRGPDGAGGAAGYGLVTELVCSMCEDPWYAVAMFVLVWLRADPTHPTDAARLVFETLMEIANATHQTEMIARQARGALALFVPPIPVARESDAFACLLYACASSAARVVAAVAAPGDDGDGVAMIGVALAEVVRTHAQIGDVSMCAPCSSDRETYGLTGTAASLMKVEAALRMVPGIAAIARQFAGSQKRPYSPQYAADVVAFVDALKSASWACVDRLPAAARGVLEAAHEYKTSRLIFYIAVALAFDYPSFLDALLILENPLCARIVLAAAGAAVRK
jgi:hypothetical protein